jgi:Flp pilus assembly protein TadD
MREYVSRDPEGVGMTLGRCFNLRDFGAAPEAARCVAGLAERAPAQNNVLRAQAQLAYDAGEISTALDLFDRAGDPAPELRAALLLRLDRATEALDVYSGSRPSFSPSRRRRSSGHAPRSR